MNTIKASHIQIFRFQIVLLLITVASCSSGPHVYSPDIDVIGSDRSTRKLVGDLILAAGLFLEPWKIDRVQVGQMAGVLEYGQHRANVLINFDAHHFNIVYKNSENFDYDHEDKTIHPKFNFWVKKLEKRINDEIHYRLQLMQ